MRKEALWALLLAIILVAVLFAQRQLKESLKNPDAMSEFPFGEEILPAEQALDETADEAPNEIGNEDEPKDLVVFVDETQPLPEAVQSQLQLAIKIFHQKDQVRNASSEDLHDTPKALHEAAEQLANVVEADAQNPQHAQAFREFYLQCARDEESLTVIRAQCLEKYTQRAGMSEEGKTKLLSELPEAVVRLYKAL